MAAARRGSSSTWNSGRSWTPTSVMSLPGWAGCCRSWRGCNGSRRPPASETLKSTSGNWRSEDKNFVASRELCVLSSCGECKPHDDKQTSCTCTTQTIQNKSTENEEAVNLQFNSSFPFVQEMQKTFSCYKCLMISVNLSGRHFLRGDSAELRELQEALGSANHSWTQACGGLESWERRLHAALMQCQVRHGDRTCSFCLWNRFSSLTVTCSSSGVSRDAALSAAVARSGREQTLFCKQQGPGDLPLRHAAAPRHFDGEQTRHGNLLHKDSL